MFCQEGRDFIAGYRENNAVQKLIRKGTYILNDEYFMSLALKEARKALLFDDVPIGALIVSNGVVIAKGYNQVEKLGDSTAHAEIIAIRKAIKKTGYKHLLDCTLYVTLEPCNMCSGAIVLSRLNRLVFGANDPKAGACGSLANVPNDERLNHNCEITRGILEDECSVLLKSFFKEVRQRKKNG